MPVAIRSLDTLWFSPSDVMGSTLMPSSPMRKGNSLVPCSAPRYFTTRRCRVAIWSLTRWSSRMTQSETYSSSPWRVSCSRPRSAVMTAVTPLSLSQRKSRRNSARRMASLGRLANSASSVSSTTRLAPMESIA